TRQTRIEKIINEAEKEGAKSSARVRSGKSSDSGRIETTVVDGTSRQPAAANSRLLRSFAIGYERLVEILDQAHGQ
ncbi:MAG: hypothetical protein M1830_001797, partial [Pleopsidium flavum]